MIRPNKPKMMSISRQAVAHARRLQTYPDL